MSAIDYRTIEGRIRDELTECRRLFTRSVTDIPEYSTLDKIRENYQGFLREVFKAQKSALAILISRILYLEKLLIKTNANNPNCPQKAETSKLGYWKRLLELSFNTLVWLNVGMDRSNVRRVFKGPRYGDLAQQNIGSVLAYIGEVNKIPNEIAIPLDFSPFSPICDILKVSYSENDNTVKRLFIEAKSGKVNDEILETIKAGTKEAYLGFFDNYGDKGIKQMERTFRQAMMLEKSIELVDAKPGVYRNPEKLEKNLIISANETNAQHFYNKIAELLDRAGKKEFAVDHVDNCLVIGAVNNEDDKSLMLGEYDVRLYIFHSFINPETLKGAEYPPDLPQILNSIRLTDWREGFGSVVLEPVTLRPVPDEPLIDLLLGRRGLKFYFDPQEFIILCNSRGVEARLTSKKEASRLRSSGSAKGLVNFGGQFIQLSVGGGNFIIGEGILHEMIFNWYRPTSVIDQIKQIRSPFRQ